MNENDDIFVSVDIEATGLLMDTDPSVVVDPLILEFGVMILDLDLDVIASSSWLFWSAEHAARLRWMKDNPEVNGNAFVLKMHEESGLWDACQEFGVDLPFGAHGIVRWMESQGLQSGGNIKERPALVGSGPQYDRGVMNLWLPDVRDCFHYRNIDVSSLKETCRRVNKPLYEKLATEAPKVEAHRSISDLHDTRLELKFYFDNFVYQAEV